VREVLGRQLWTITGLILSAILLLAVAQATPEAAPEQGEPAQPGSAQAARIPVSHGLLALPAAPVKAVRARTVTAKSSATTTAAQVLNANPADYVGETTCLTCHEDQKYAGTAHGLKTNNRTPAATHGCESCHGPGKAHVDAGGDPANIIRPAALTKQESSALCATCHTSRTHALWAGSQHDQRNVGCITCHSVHAAKGATLLKAKSEQETCATCHRTVVNKTNRFHHMPVREGGLTCTSCHNVHGSTNVRLLKVGTTIDESCSSCHADKRGPYLWEHAPVSESCITCHDPHGSNNDRMLVSKQPFLCQRCHVTSRHPPTVYDGFLLNNSSNANKVYGRSCTVCHQLVHGSNAPSGKALLR
jgi:DmsE family decaheme c-type cytochrome